MLAFHKWHLHNDLLRIASLNSVENSTSHRNLSFSRLASPGWRLLTVTLRHSVSVDPPGPRFSVVFGFSVPLTWRMFQHGTAQRREEKSFPD